MIDAAFAEAADDPEAYDEALVLVAEFAAAADWEALLLGFDEG
jgi:hypothetical protein